MTMVIAGTLYYLFLINTYAIGQFLYERFFSWSPRS